MTCKAVLNELTRAEIDEIQCELIPELRKCLNCGVPKKMRRNQVFCCSSCKNEYRHESARLLYDELTRLKAQITADKIESAQEIGRLEAENLRLRAEIARLREG